MPYIVSRYSLSGGKLECAGREQGRGQGCLLSLPCSLAEAPQSAAWLAGQNYGTMLKPSLTAFIDMLCLKSDSYYDGSSLLCHAQIVSAGPVDSCVDIYCHCST